MGVPLPKINSIVKFLKYPFLSGAKTDEHSEFDLGAYPEEKGIADRMIACEKQIGYRFKNKELLVSALKHRSFLAVTQEERYLSNERLEFLGDAVLDLVTTEYIYQKYPKKSEGELSKMKSILVSKKVLASVAKDLHLGEYILINYGEEKSGGRKRISILANTFESVLGALYLDSGSQPAKQFVISNLLKKSNRYLNLISVQNYKSNLLEYSQSKGWGIPDYNVITEHGPDHEKIFKISVTIAGKKLSTGTGPSKKRAEQSAARKAIEVLKEKSDLK